MTGRSPTGRATRASTKPANGLGQKASVPNAKQYAPHGSLTGNARARQNWRGKMILEVEYHDSVWLGMVYRFTKWRDAKPSDFAPELSIVLRGKSA